MSSQVPVWVPMVVALLGVTGVVAAQFVNAWREDRRWKREKEREELRWQRTKAIENAKLQLEYAGQWREQKVKIYGDLVRLVREVSLTVGHYFNRKPPPEINDEKWSTLSRELSQKIDALLVELERVAGEALVIAPPALGDVLENVHKIAFSFYSDLFKDAGYGEGEEEPISPDYARELQDGLLPLVQADLGVSSAQIDDDVQKR